MPSLPTLTPVSLADISSDRPERVREGWETLARRYTDRIVSLARMHGVDADDAAEISQRVVLRFPDFVPHFYNRHPDTDGRRTSFRRYLNRVVRNETLTLLRRRAGRRESDLSVADGSVPDGLNGSVTDGVTGSVPEGAGVAEEAVVRRRQLSDSLRRALADLRGSVAPTTYRAFEMRIHTDMTWQQIADEIGVPRNHCQKYYERCIRRLQNMLGGGGDAK